MSVVSINKLENSKVEMEISVGAEEFKAAVDLAFKKNGSKVNVPGFRKGKATRKMIEKLYGEGVFYEDAVNSLYPGAYAAAIKENDIEPVERAEIEVTSVDAQGFAFKATVTVKPEVVVGDYKGVTADKKCTVVTDAEVDAQIEKQRERNGRTITVEDRPAQLGDQTVIDFEGFIDGVAFEGGKGEDFELTLGSNQFIPGFEEQIVGHQTGEEFDVNISFPDNYHVENLKGKPAVFKVKLSDLKMLELPELDDEFAKDVSDFDTLEELRADAKAKLLEEKTQKNQDDFENALIKNVLENVQVDIPQVMIETRIDDLIKDFEYRLQSQGLNLQTYLTYTGMDMAAFRKGFEEQALRQVKVRLTLEGIVKLEEIVPTDEELDAEYEKMAKSYGMELDKLKTIAPVSEITKDVAVAKAIDIIRDHAIVNEVAEIPEIAEA